MITPKFREIMTRVIVRSFTIRLWWNYTPEGHSCIDKAAGFGKYIFHSSAADVFGIEQELLNYFSPNDGLAAYEILVTETGNGIVGYIEWP